MAHKTDFCALKGLTEVAKRTFRFWINANHERRPDKGARWGAQDRNRLNGPVYKPLFNLLSDARQELLCIPGSFTAYTAIRECRL